MSLRARASIVVVLLAAAHAAWFIAYQRADWDTLWTDQNGYMRLGRVLAERGRFTRYPDSPRFIPEAIRTPGYPAFLAVIDRTVGESHVAIAVAQGALFAGICLIVFALARRVASERLAAVAAVVTALYAPIPYYGALALTEVFTTFLVTTGMLLWLKAQQTNRAATFAAAGVAFAWTALTRPTFQYLPLFLIAGGGAVAVVRGAARPRWRGPLVMIGAYVLVLVPWMVYNVRQFHEITFTPAGGMGRTLFEGYWQGALPGRLENTLTNLADVTPDRLALDDKIRALAAEVGFPAEPMLRYGHQWQDIRKIWTEPQDPWERTMARIAADREYFRVAMENIRRDPLRHAWRRAVRGPVILWAAEIPVRYSDINRLPPWTIAGMWLPQLALMSIALIGVPLVYRRGATTEAFAFGALLLYVTAVHVPLYAEARYSLPAKPIVLILAVVAMAHFSSARPRPVASSQAVHGPPRTV